MLAAGETSPTRSRHESTESALSTSLAYVPENAASSHADAETARLRDGERLDLARGPVAPAHAAPLASRPAGGRSNRCELPFTPKSGRRSDAVDRRAHPGAGAAAAGATLAESAARPTVAVTARELGALRAQRHHRRERVAVARAEAARGEVDAVEEEGIDGADEGADRRLQLHRVEERRVVREGARLGEVAAAHVQAGALVHSLHAGQRLDGAVHVGRGARGGDHLERTERGAALLARVYRPACTVTGASAAAAGSATSTTGPASRADASARRTSRKPTRRATSVSGPACAVAKAKAPAESVDGSLQRLEREHVAAGHRRAGRRSHDAAHDRARRRGRRLGEERWGPRARGQSAAPPRRRRDGERASAIQVLVRVGGALLAPGSAVCMRRRWPGATRRGNDAPANGRQAG
jgi:hypothetical protein